MRTFYDSPAWLVPLFVLGIPLIIWSAAYQGGKSAGIMQERELCELSR